MDLDGALCAEAFAPRDMAHTLNDVSHTRQHAAVPLPAEIAPRSKGYGCVPGNFPSIHLIAGAFAIALDQTIGVDPGSTTHVRGTLPPAASCGPRRVRKNQHVPAALGRTPVRSQVHQPTECIPTPFADHIYCTENSPPHGSGPSSKPSSCKSNLCPAAVIWR